MLVNFTLIRLNSHTHYPNENKYIKRCLENESKNGTTPAAKANKNEILYDQ